ncbi:class I SAM-dependent methyltransferase [Melghirimyces algeriensis]|uniref:Ubiquinone/menaquinone biosynthesis C-methylase UbiE n=1 Tax=Melghirimyces algeriensis TaxID=910412 RepID=A0A521FHA5_9BACL|nr:class I SAM-dependent methyltransferase [Melghirimyces algeriensis]SMO95525.1 Ubiquinone/menaquinone biosynthesis C-methylase UbiE [Melghirimyces algeriensis]
MPETPTKKYKGPGMNGLIGTWYAKNTKKKMEKYTRDAKKVLKALSEGDSVLDLAPGPGYLSIELAKLGDFQITGLDISEKFVQMAQNNADQAGVDVDFRHGDAAQIPFEDHIFDLVVCRAAFKNFAQPLTALNEMKRVLKPGGKAVIIDFKGDASKADINQFVTDDMGYKGLNALIIKWMFRNVMIKQAYTKEKFMSFIKESDFKTCDLREGLVGIEAWLES